MNVQGQTEECWEDLIDVERNSEKLRSAHNTAKAEEYSGTEPETNSDYDGGKLIGGRKWEESLLKGKDGDGPIIVEEDKVGVFGQSYCS